MKSNFEKAFENSLKNYEVPYDPSAWESLSAKLGSKAVEGADVGIKRWLLVAGLAMFIIAGAFIVRPENGTVTQVTEQKTQPVKEAVQTELSDNTNGTRTEEDAVLSEEIIENEGAFSTETGTPLTHAQTTPLNREETTINNPAVRENEPNQTDLVKTPTVNNTDNQGTERANLPSSISFISGVITPKSVCVGESFTISNPGKKGQLVHWYFSENGEGTYGVLKAGEKIEYKPVSNTTVTFKNEKGVKMEEVAVTVSPSPSADFAYEANIYEKGLPVVHFETYTNYTDHKWSFADEGTSDQADPTHSFFEKGDYTVTLEVANANGCKNQISKTVSIHEKYNLMAVDAFIPNGVDPRNRTFMPYSLTERDVRFQLTIVDPMTNEVIFTSNNAANAWDGTNQRTGKMTEAAKAYIWKVQIYNPLPNERPIYTGTIVHN